MLYLRNPGPHIDAQDVVTFIIINQSFAVIMILIFHSIFDGGIRDMC